MLLMTLFSVTIYILTKTILLLTKIYQRQHKLHAIIRLLHYFNIYYLHISFNELRSILTIKV